MTPSAVAFSQGSANHALPPHAIFRLQNYYQLAFIAWLLLNQAFMQSSLCLLMCQLFFFCELLVNGATQIQAIIIIINIIYYCCYY